ncbi:hypothetical protein HDE_11826 [Halotydeus destructor]|nr:hypothetical protein HDE_11826 [Halotydeus destructor]
MRVLWLLPLLALGQLVAGQREDEEGSHFPTMDEEPAGQSSNYNGQYNQYQGGQQQYGGRSRYQDDQQQYGGQSGYQGYPNGPNSQGGYGQPRWSGYNQRSPPRRQQRQQANNYY